MNDDPFEEFATIYEGRFTDTNELRWFLDWHQSGETVHRFADRASRPEIEAVAGEMGLPVQIGAPRF